MTFRAPLTLIALALLALFAQPHHLAAQSEVKLDSLEARAGYAVGVQVGGQVANVLNGPAAGTDKEAFKQAIIDVLDGADLKLTNEQIGEALKAWQAAAADRAKKKGEVAMKRGAEFREANKSKPGVKVTDSGIQYKVLKSGPADGKNPEKTSNVVVHYHGTLIDGKVFDSSVNRGQPATFPLNRVIPGWTEIVQMMKPGDKWAVVIPPEMAYGERGAGGDIGPNETLQFDIELIEIK